MKAVDVGTDFLPYVGSLKDIYRGARDGDMMTFTMGVVGLTADVATMGARLALKGTLKQIAKRTAKEITERAAREAAKKIVKEVVTNPKIKLTTSSKSNAPSRTYTIYNKFGELYKFGVTDANFKRYKQSLKEAGPGSYGTFSDIMPKNQAHKMEKYLRILQYNSTGQYNLPGMKYPFPVNFDTGKSI